MGKERLTDEVTIGLLDRGLKIPHEVAEKVYRRLFEIENEAEKKKKSKKESDK